jgi:hypothetical protein
VDTGSRQENAINKKMEHFQAKHAPAKAGVGTGSRTENAIKDREKHFPTNRYPLGGRMR